MLGHLSLGSAVFDLLCLRYGSCFKSNQLKPRSHGNIYGKAAQLNCHLLLGLRSSMGIRLGLATMPFISVYFLVSEGSIRGIYLSDLFRLNLYLVVAGLT